MLKTIISLAFMVSPIFAGSASAQSIGFGYFDADHNGQITQGEISAEGDRDIITAMDNNKDGAVTPDEWQTKGRGARFVEEGGVDDRGVTRRWIAFKIVDFEIIGKSVNTSLLEGQAPLAADATPEDVMSVRRMLEARFNAVPTS
jgi:hypothetical protein